MLLLVNGLAPWFLTAALVEPQLVTPTMTFGFGWVPLGGAAVPPTALRVGRVPKVSSHGPPLEPPHIKEPMIVFDELLPDTKPCESLRCIRLPWSRQRG